MVVRVEDWLCIVGVVKGLEEVDGGWIVVVLFGVWFFFLRVIGRMFMFEMLFL